MCGIWYDSNGDMNDDISRRIGDKVIVMLIVMLTVIWMVTYCRRNTLWFWRWYWCVIHGGADYTISDDVYGGIGFDIGRNGGDDDDDNDDYDDDDGNDNDDDDYDGWRCQVMVTIDGGDVDDEKLIMVMTTAMINL